MLYLNPPYYVIDGVSLMPDHEDAAAVLLHAACRRT